MSLIQTGTIFLLHICMTIIWCYNMKYMSNLQANALLFYGVCPIALLALGSPHDVGLFRACTTNFKYIFKMVLAGVAGSFWCLKQWWCKVPEMLKHCLFLRCMPLPPQHTHIHSYSGYSSTWPLNTHTQHKLSVKRGTFHETLAGRDTHQASITTGLSHCVVNGLALMI